MATKRSTAKTPPASATAVTAVTPPSHVIGQGVMQYKQAIFSSADTLRGAAIKNSEWPSYMMPFFGLALVESRLLRTRQEKLKAFEVDYQRTWDDKNPEDVDWLTTELEATNYGYHQEVGLHGKSLKDVCSTVAGHFRQRLMAYLEGYDADTQKFLGVNVIKGLPSYLGIELIIDKLWALPDTEQQNTLYVFVKKWADINFDQLNNSEITTLEEHVKREWGDISADTAGEQYTPYDMIQVVCAVGQEILYRNPHRDMLSIYDMTCGGGNFLFAAQDHYSKVFPHASLEVFGQELNSTLFALAALEARFRSHARIEYGNTLLQDKFDGKTFDVIVANQP